MASELIDDAIDSCTRELLSACFEIAEEMEITKEGEARGPGPDYRFYNLCAAYRHLVISRNLELKKN